MANKDFFDSQTDLTASKILIYRQYLNSFLPKVLMQYGRCFIVDFFCGCGKNGNEDGSPLVLLNVAKKMLESPVLRCKQPNAEIEQEGSSLFYRHATVFCNSSYLSINFLKS